MDLFIWKVFKEDWEKVALIFMVYNQNQSAIKIQISFVLTSLVELVKDDNL
jgi:hypothetical protein